MCTNRRHFASSAAYFKKSLHVHFSESGTHAREIEEATYINFMDFLDECEGIFWLLVHCVSYSLTLINTILLCYR